MEFNDAILHETGERSDVPRPLREALSWSQLNKARTFWSFDPETNPPLFAMDCYQGLLYDLKFSIDLMAESEANNRLIEKLVRAIDNNLDKVKVHK